MHLPMDGRRTSNLANEVRLLIGVPWKVNQLGIETIC